MTVGFIGKACWEKTYFLMYLAKILSQGEKVTLVTVNSHLTPDLEVYNHSDTLVIQKDMPERSDEGQVLVDVDRQGMKGWGKVYLVTETDRYSLEVNEDLFGTYDQEGCSWLFLNMIMDSKINEKYLTARLGIHKKESEVLLQYLNDNDLSVHMENGYNETIELRHLSKPYKKLLMRFVADISDQPVKEQGRWLKKAERSK